MGNVVRAAFGVATVHQHSDRSCVKVNKQGGFVASWRSMGDASWAEDVYLLAAFHRMLWLAQVAFSAKKRAARNEASIREKTIRGPPADAAQAASAMPTRLSFILCFFAVDVCS